MRRIYKIVGSMLAAGVLIAGIGSGVAFAEYSSFEYGGEVTLEGSQRFTKTLKYKVKAKEDNNDLADTKAVGEKRVLNVEVDYHYTMVEDTSIPEDMVSVTIAYLADNKDVKPEIIEYTDEGSDGIYVDCDYQYNDFRNLMRAKDSILSDLKNRKISGYQFDGVEAVEIHVNPESDFTVNINGFYNNY